MRKTQLLLACCAMAVLAACAAKKKAASTANATEANPTPYSDNYLYSNATNTFVPGDAQLSAIHVKYADATMDQLKKGYGIYTQGACINCHSPKNVYDYNETDWNDILNDMALRASLTNEEKEAVYRYVLSMKATQPGK